MGQNGAYGQSGTLGHYWVLSYDGILGQIKTQRRSKTLGQSRELGRSDTLEHYRTLSSEGTLWQTETLG